MQTIYNVKPRFNVKSIRILMQDADECEAAMNARIAYCERNGIDSEWDSETDRLLTKLRALLGEIDSYEEWMRQTNLL